MEGDGKPETAIDSEQSNALEHLPQEASSGYQSTFHPAPSQEPVPAVGTDEGGSNDVAEASAHSEGVGAAQGDGEPAKPLSKNQQKKLKRKQLFEEKKVDRKRMRKEKKQELRAKREVEREEKIAAAKAAGLDPEEALKSERQGEKPRKFTPNPAPISFILDCDFEDLMFDTEIVSLSSQVVRSYSQNRLSKHQAHMFISSFGGKMRTRFETVMANNHKNWTGVHFVEGDFRAAAKQASELMAGPEGGNMPDVLQAGGDDPALQEPEKSNPTLEPEPDDVDQSIVYLTSESPYTLERLEPYTSYVIGGLVDRNRQKGLCYKRAVGMKVRTAKLPIGEYMAMQSRFVLTTNQVVEIMAKWLECGDWGEAFLGSIPKRKGGVLKGQKTLGGQSSEAGGDDVQDAPDDEENHGNGNAADEV